MAGRGGLQQPKNPAAVSTPGSGRRTDGGAGSKSQPLRVATGGAYGETKAATEQQQAAPLATGGPTGGPSGGAAPQGGPPQGGAFGPTQRPMENPSAGIGPNQDSIASNPQAALRILYSRFPHPSIARLIDWSSGGGMPE